MIDQDEDRQRVPEPPMAAEDAGSAVSAPAEAQADPVGEALRLPPALHAGMVVDATVTAVGPDHLLCDVGGKADGVLVAAEAALGPDQSLATAFAPGQALRVAVIGFDAESGAPRLSQRRAVEADAWRRLADAQRDGQPVEAVVREAVKGGLVLDAGVRAFMPASQVERGHTADLGIYVGQTMVASILELDRRRNKLILSRRAILAEEHRRQGEALWAELEEGQVREGVVKGLADFGAFIDLGGVDGLLHVSAMSWGRINRPGDMLAVGDRLRVKILRLDREQGRVSLGLKQVGEDPWSTAAERYPVGAVVSGRVTRLTAYGAFVELEPGIDGLIHISQLADRRVEAPAEVVHEGEEIRCKVLAVAPQEHRIRLSLREAEAERRGGEAPQPAPVADDQAAVTLGDIVGGDLGARLRQRAEAGDAEGEGPA